MPLNKKTPAATSLITSAQGLSQPSDHPDILLLAKDGVADLTPSTASSPSSPSSPTSLPGSQVPARQSFDGQKYDGKHLCESDIEACLPDVSTKSNARHSRTACRSTKEYPVWPGHRTLKAQLKAERRPRGCNPLQSLGKRTRIWVKILIGLLVVGLAVGIGVGISKVVGGGVWKSNS